MDMFAEATAASIAAFMAALTVSVVVDAPVATSFVPVGVDASSTFTV
jgi:hypothetical protein